MGLAGDFLTKESTEGKQTLPPPDAVLDPNIQKAVDPTGKLPTSGNPSQGCGPGGDPSGSVGAAPPGVSPEGYDNITLPGSTGMPNAGIMNIANKAAGDMGCKFNVTPHGGRSDRDKGTQNHPTGNAMDGYLNCGGGGATIAQKQQFISGAVKNGATGIGTYDSGFIHVDNYHRSLAVWGDDGHGTSADGWARQAATGTSQDPNAAAANAAQGAGPGGQGGECATSEGGCAPMSTSAPQVAASLAQNKGMQMPTNLQDGLAAMANATVPGISQAVQQAAAVASGAAGGLPQALGAAGLGSNVTSMITSGIASKVAGMGANMLPGIVGNMAGSFMSGGGIGSVVGMAQGLLTSKISGIAGQLLNSAAPQLGQFMNMFNMAAGAAGMANQLAQTMQGTLGQAFGNAGSLFQGAGLALNNLSKLPGGLNLSQNPYLDAAFHPLNGPLNEAIRSSFNLVGNPTNVLSRVVKAPTMNAFGSMFYDWNGLATNGFTNFTNNLPGLGSDLMKLGRLADVKDVFRMGTPGQIAQQLISHNLSYSTGLGDFMSRNRLKIADLSNSANDELIAEFLQSVNDPDVIEEVKNNLSMHPELEFDNLGDLLNPEKLFPESYDYNYFEDLKDMAVQLSMCGGVGRMQSLYDLGQLMLALEPTYELDKLYGEAAPYNMADMVDFVDSNAPNGRFHPKGELTIADFIGSAAGYVHSNTLPKIAELTERLYQDTAYLDDYVDLMGLLQQTLAGDFSSPTNVIVPGFGTYLSLDDAVSDIADAIEAELASAKAAMKADPDAWDMLNEIESAHFESSAYILHEEKLRNIYGINIGDSRKTETFLSDGTTATITLGDLVSDANTLNVFISGVWQTQGTDYTVNTANRTITLSSVPPAGRKIAVQYETGRYKPSVNNSTAWQFAGNLENYALQTGLGNAAEFLSKITSDDEHGQRIKALLRQARNKERLRNFGLNCTAWDQANSGAENYIHYTNHTGIWTDDVDRAGEIWLQNTQDVKDNYSYQLSKIIDNRHHIGVSVESSLKNVMRQLIFYDNGNLIMSDLFVDLYQAEDENSLKTLDREDLLVPYSSDLPTSGYILGNYREIISEIMRLENLNNQVFNTELSTDTATYIRELNIDFKQLIRFLQKMLLVNGMLQVGLNETDYRDIFGVPSASKIILQNLASDY